MSEYQYYEFQALDRRLTEKEMEELGRISSRAEITPTSLTNEYQWGSFKGNPAKLMEKYFDLFFYFANWGTHRLMLRLPMGALKAEETKPYETEFLGSAAHKTSVVLDFHSADESGDWEGDEGPKAHSLGRIREELMAGDKRALYLGWLNAVCQDYTDVDDEDVEPPVPPGLADLSPALTDLADFLRINLDLIAVAAERSEILSPAADDPATIRKWLAATPAKQKDEWLWRVLQGEEFGLRAEMTRDFQQSQNPKKPAAVKGDKSSRRTAGELRKAADSYGEKRRQAEAEKRAATTAHKEKEAAAAQAKRLAALSGKEETAWERVGSWIASKDSEHYDQAVDLLVDLKKLAQQNNQVQAFVTKVQDIRRQNASKQALLRRLKKAALY